MLRDGKEVAIIKGDRERNDELLLKSFFGVTAFNL